jgi:hypothetical protein
MSLPPILTMPTSVGIADVNFSLTRVVASSISPYTLEDQTFKWPGEQWRVDFNMPPMGDPAIANEWKAFGVKLEGKYGQFYMGDPSATSPVGVGTGTPRVMGGGQIGNSIDIDGLVPGTSNVLRAGDFVQIGTGVESRLHMQVEDLNADGLGRATLTLHPAVRRNLPDNTEVSFHDCVGLFRMTSNTFEWRVTPGPIYQISFQAEEVI